MSLPLNKTPFLKDKVEPTQILRPTTADPTAYTVLGQFMAKWTPIFPQGRARPTDRDFGVPIQTQVFYVSISENLADTENLTAKIDDLLFRVNAIPTPPAPGDAAWASVDSRYAFRIEDPYFHKTPPFTLLRVARMPL